MQGRDLTPAEGKAPPLPSEPIDAGASAESPAGAEASTAITILPPLDASQGADPSPPPTSGPSPTEPKPARPKRTRGLIGRTWRFLREKFRPRHIKGWSLRFKVAVCLSFLVLVFSLIQNRLQRPSSQEDDPLALAAVAGGRPSADPPEKEPETRKPAPERSRERSKTSPPDATGPESDAIAAEPAPIVPSIPEVPTTVATSVTPLEVETVPVPTEDRTTPPSTAETSEIETVPYSFVEIGDATAGDTTAEAGPIEPTSVPEMGTEYVPLPTSIADEPPPAEADDPSVIDSPFGGIESVTDIAESMESPALVEVPDALETAPAASEAELRMPAIDATELAMPGSVATSPDPSEPTPFAPLDDPAIAGASTPSFTEPEPIEIGAPEPFAGGPPFQATELARPSEPEIAPEPVAATPTIGEEEPGPPDFFEPGLAPSPVASVPPTREHESAPPEDFEPEIAPEPVAATTPSREAGPDVVGSRIAPIAHVVRSKENFWKISQYYYGSGWYYRALWDANREQVPKIDELYVGTTLLIPAPEDLDRSLIPTEVPRGRPAPATGPDPNPARGGERAIARRDDRAERTSADDRPVEPLPRERSERPLLDDEPLPREPIVRVHSVQPYETLRSIARDELGDVGRAGEIERLNRGLLDDPDRLPIGARLRLPEPARRPMSGTPSRGAVEPEALPR